MDAAEIMQSVNIVDYIGQYTDLKPIGGGEYRGLSPFTGETTPSFFVNADKQKYYDYSAGGGGGGNVAEFVKNYNHCSFQQAMDILRRYAGISDETMAAVTRLSASSIAKKYRRPADEEKIQMTNDLPKDVMEQYIWDEEKLKPWHDEGIGYDAMKSFGVRYDPVSNRIMYPIKDMSGKIINVAGRTLDPAYKEKKLRKYTYFYPLGTLDLIYGYSDNRQAIADAGEMIIFEGAKSVMKCATWGIGNAAAILTSHLNPRQFAWLVKLGHNVTFALDAEVNPKQDHEIMKLTSYINVYTVYNWDNILSDKDAPVDKGKDVFMTLYDKRIKL